MKSVARLICIVFLGCFITLSGVPAGMVGLVCPAGQEADDAKSAETASVAAATLVNHPSAGRRESGTRVWPAPGGSDAIDRNALPAIPSPAINWPMA